VSRPGRRAIAAEALATVSMALVTSRDASDRAVPRRALFAWVFNPGTRNLTQPAEIAAAPTRAGRP
jgi:hypothetical protein